MKRCPVCQTEFADRYTFCDQDGSALNAIDARSNESQAQLIVRQSDGRTQTLNVSAKSVVIGKAPECDLTIQDGAISRRHAQIETRDGKVFVKDLNSLNGTFVNDRKIGDQDQKLNDGDKIGLGRTKIEFHLLPLSGIEFQTAAQEEAPPRVTTIIDPSPILATTPPALPSVEVPQANSTSPKSEARVTALQTEPSGVGHSAQVSQNSGKFRVRPTGELEVDDGGQKEGLIEQVHRLAQPILLDGRYELTEQLAQDESGTLYRARRKMLGDEVAVRVLRPELVDDPVAVERFHRQAQVAAHIKHPNSVQVFDYGHSPEGVAFIVEELLSGQTLRDLINVERGLSLPHVVSLMNQICGAVHAAHVHGIVLRDLKPETIYIEHDASGNEVVKVGCYGLAKVDDSELPTEDGQPLTGPLGVLGSPQYTSPEQWMNRPLDARSDVYALGAILFELLTGSPPYTEQFITSHISSPVPDLTDFGRSDMDEGIAEVVTRALAKDPADRQSSALLLAEELEAASGVRRGLVSRLTGMLPVSPLVVPKRTINTGEISLPSVLPREKVLGRGAFNPVVIALMIEAFLSRLSSGMIKTAVPLYALLVFGMDITSVMGLVLIQNIVPLLLRPVFGSLADKYGKKKVFLVSLSIRTLVSVLYAVATLPLLFVISLIRGVADSAKGPSASAMIADNTDESHIAQAYSWYTTTKSTSGGIGEALAAFVLVFLLTIYAGFTTVTANIAVLDKITRKGTNAEEIVKDASRVTVGAPLPGNEAVPAAHRVIRLEQREMKLSQVPIEDLPKVVNPAPLKKALVMIFIASTVLSLGSLLLVALFIKEKKKEKKDKKDKGESKTDLSGTPQQRPNVWAFALLGTALTAPAYMVTGEFFTILAVKLEVTPQSLGWIKIVSETAVPLLFGPFFGWLADRIGTSKVIALRSLANLATSALFWIVPWFAGTALLGAMMGFARAIDEVGKAAFKPTWGAIAAKVSSFNLTARSRTMGILEGGVDASDLAFPVIAGVMLQYLSLGPLMLVRGVLAIVAEIYGFVLMRKYRI
ncbi:MAG: MFS transporter [Acidobacteria bacterium]|nr:MFS transporter [Acidobacteriota bacterium]